LNVVFSIIGKYSILLLQKKLFLSKLMKKEGKMRFKILIFSLMLSTSAFALDPFSVYSQNAPEGCVSGLDTNKEVDLANLIQIAICNNPALNRDFMSVKSREADLGATKSEYLPTVSASAGAEKSFSKNQDDDKTAKSNPYSANVGIGWLIYDFGRRGATTDQMRAYLESESFNYNSALQELVLNVNQAYFDLLSNQEVLKSAQESVKSYKKSYEETSKRYQLGMVSLSDKLLAQTTYQKSELAVLQAQNAIEKSAATLATLLNLPADTKFDLVLPKRDKDNDITKLQTDMTVQQMMETAVQLRPEMKSALSSQDAARYGIDIAKSGHYPTISAKGSAGYNDSWQDSRPYQMSANAGLSVSVPIFDGFKTTYGVQKANFQYKKAEAGVQDIKESIQKEVFNAYQDYTTAVSSYKVNQEVLKSAKESERVTFVSYQAGKESILNLLTAQAQLADARQGLAVSFYGVLTAKAKLYRAIGQF
jgi:TolC family type I secretion outer membrane protein